MVELLDALGSAQGWDPVVTKLATVLLAVGVLATATIAWFHGERGRQIVYGPEALLLILIAALGIVLSVGVLRSSGFQSARDESPESPAVDDLGATFDMSGPVRTAQRKPDHWPAERARSIVSPVPSPPQDAAR